MELPRDLLAQLRSKCDQTQVAIAEHISKAPAWKIRRLLTFFTMAEISDDAILKIWSLMEPVERAVTFSLATQMLLEMLAREPDTGTQG